MKYRTSPSSDARALLTGTCAVLVLLLAASAVAAADRRHSTDRLIVRLGDWAEADRGRPMHTDQAATLALLGLALAGLSFARRRKVRWGRQ